MPNGHHFITRITVFGNGRLNGFVLDSHNDPLLKRGEDPAKHLVEIPLDFLAVCRFPSATKSGIPPELSAETLPAFLPAFAGVFQHRDRLFWSSCWIKDNPACAGRHQMKRCPCSTTMFVKCLVFNTANYLSMPRISHSEVLD